MAVDWMEPTLAEARNGLVTPLYFPRQVVQASTELTPSPLLLQVPRASWAWATKAALMSGTVATSKTLRAVSHCQLTPD